MSEQGENLLAEAIRKFNSGDRLAGLKLLQQSADSGNKRAVLFYADNLFNEDKSQAYTYLDKAADKGMVGALHRKVLLQLFFDTRNAATQHFLDLQQDAQAGDIQSLVALIAVFEKHPEQRNIYLALLQQTAPELYQDLALPTAVPVKPLSELQIPELAEDFVNAFNHGLQPATETLAKDIGLVLAKAALSDIECNYLKLRYNSMLRPSLVVDPQSGRPIRDPHRTGSVVTINPELLDWTMLTIEWRMENISGICRRYGEPTNLIHYSPGQQYKGHYDAIVGQAALCDTNLNKFGQRQKTVLCYLNSVQSGGATVFPKLNISVNASRGDMLMFDNIDTNGQLLHNSYHAGQPVREGDKWILSKWVRQSVTDYGTLAYG
tara:strand:+ start:3829 stop:4962 length:1134 start_codon:yes stop_codon:yes gene_type:complete